MTLPGPYPPTVNESETITDAQPVGEVRGHREPYGVRAMGLEFPVTHNIERS